MAQQPLSPISTAHSATITQGTVAQAWDISENISVLSWDACILFKFPKRRDHLVLARHLKPLTGHTQVTE